MSIFSINSVYSHSMMMYRTYSNDAPERCTSSLLRPLQLWNTSLPRSSCTEVLLSTSCTCPERTLYTTLCRRNQSILRCKCSWLEHCSETVRWSLTDRLCTMLQPHPGAQTPAPPPSPGNAPGSRFAGRTTGPEPPAPTRGRTGHRWRRFTPKD